jgi:hypothetical protein
MQMPLPSMMPGRDCQERWSKRIHPHILKHLSCLIKVCAMAASTALGGNSMTPVNFMHHHQQDLSTMAATWMNFAATLAAAAAAAMLL